MSNNQDLDSFLFDLFGSISEEEEDDNMSDEVMTSIEEGNMSDATMTSIDFAVETSISSSSLAIPLMVSVSTTTTTPSALDTITPITMSVARIFPLGMRAPEIIYSSAPSQVAHTIACESTIEIVNDVVQPLSRPIVHDVGVQVTPLTVVPDMILLNILEELSELRRAVIAISAR